MFQKCDLPYEWKVDCAVFNSVLYQMLSIISENHVTTGNATGGTQVASAASSYQSTLVVVAFVVILS